MGLPGPRQHHVKPTRWIRLQETIEFLSDFEKQRRRRRNLLQVGNPKKSLISIQTVTQFNILIFVIREKECSLLIEMFMARGRLHDKAYQHVKVKIIEEMLIDAFELANERYQILVLII